MSGCQLPTENSPVPVASAPIGAMRPAPNRATILPAKGEAIAIATNPLASTIPACGRLSPVWWTRKYGEISITENVTRYSRQLAALMIAKAARRNSATCTTGCLVRASHQTNATRLTQAAGSSRKASISPSRSRGSALIMSSSDARPDASSNAPAMSKRCSPRFRRLPGAAARAAATARLSAIGARNQNTDGQPQCSTNAPPISGPLAEPIANISVKMPRAWLRRASGYRLVTSAGAQLMISPAPIPCRKRKNSSAPKLGAAAHSRNAAVFQASPARNTRACPQMSPTRPKASISPAWVST